MDLTEEILSYIRGRKSGVDIRPLFVGTEFANKGRRFHNKPIASKYTLEAQRGSATISVGITA